MTNEHDKPSGQRLYEMNRLVERVREIDELITDYAGSGTEIGFQIEDGMVQTWGELVPELCDSLEQSVNEVLRLRAALLEIHNVTVDETINDRERAQIVAEIAEAEAPDNIDEARPLMGGEYASFNRKDARHITEEDLR